MVVGSIVGHSLLSAAWLIKLGVRLMPRIYICKYRRYIQMLPQIQKGYRKCINFLETSWIALRFIKIPKLNKFVLWKMKFGNSTSEAYTGGV